MAAAAVCVFLISVSLLVVPSGASMLYFHELECNLMDCSPGLTLTREELEYKISAGFAYCSDPSSSTALSPNQCHAVFDFAYAMVKDTANGGKCITDEVFSKLSTVVTAMAAPKELPGLADDIRQQPVPPQGTLADEMVVKYGDGEIREDAYKDILAYARNDESVTRESGDDEKRYMAKTEPGSVSDAYAALLVEESGRQFRRARNASTGRFFASASNQNCNCPSSYPGTTWYPECCSVVCATYGEPAYFSVQFASCCATHSARLGQNWESYCWYYPAMGSGQATSPPDPQVLIGIDSERRPGSALH